MLLRHARKYIAYPGASGRSLRSVSSNGPSIILALSVVTGLPIALWTYKCLMLVLFQRKIIYMGYVPPGARTGDLKRVPPEHLKGLSCEQILVDSENNTTLSGIVVQRENASGSPKIVMVYFQGNAGNPLHRLPVFQRLLEPGVSADLDMSVVAVAPRSYWTSSSSRPTERGILVDYRHVLKYTLDRFPSSLIVVYGHSLGGAVAVCLLSRLFDTTQTQIQDHGHDQQYGRIRGLILENPFASIPGMVKAMYPNRWLPYRYLTPFVLDKWDAVAAIRDAQVSHSILTRLSQEMLVILSEKDEVVPTNMGAELFAISRTAPSNMGGKVVIRDALHENAWQQRQWSKEVKNYVAKIISQ